MTPDEVRYVEYNAAELPAALKWQVLSFLRIVWPEGFTGSSRYRDWITNPVYRPRHLMYLACDLVVSQLELVQLELTHEGLTYQVSAPTGVLTFPSFRREGWAGRLVQKATQRIESSGADLGLICCEPENASFYVRASGWQQVPGATILVEDRPTPQVLIANFQSSKAKQHAETFQHFPLHLDDEL
jgi:hypothetical protein